MQSECNVNLAMVPVGQTSSAADQPCTPTETAQAFKIPVLGFRQSGKTTLVEQFINCSSPVNPAPTVKFPNMYNSLVVFNGHLYQLKLIDCPFIEGKYPTSSLEEWSHYCGWGLRAATAFILVFDITSHESFQYIRRLRDQIVTNWSDKPLILVANKMDALQFCGNSSLNDSPNFTDSNARAKIRRELTVLVKKQWKGTTLVECSAKYNWHVMAVFKELMKSLENRDQSNRPAAARAVQKVFRQNQCTSM